MLRSTAWDRHWAIGINTPPLLAGPDPPDWAGSIGSTRSGINSLRVAPEAPRVRALHRIRRGREVPLAYAEVHPTVQSTPYNERASQEIINGPFPSSQVLGLGGTRIQFVTVRRNPVVARGSSSAVTLDRPRPNVVLYSAQERLGRYLTVEITLLSHSAQRTLSLSLSSLSSPAHPDAPSSHFLFGRKAVFGIFFREFTPDTRNLSSTRLGTTTSPTMATAIMLNHYAPGQSAHYGYAPPPSPPLDETSKCSLPSISSLLGLANPRKPTAETSPASQLSTKSETLPISAHNANSVMARTALPPSPPMSSEASFEGYHSPSAKSVGQMPSSSNYFFATTPPLGPMEGETRHTAVPRMPIQPSAYAPPFAPSPLMAPPAISAYYPSMQPTPPQASMPGMYFQRPLPQVGSNRFSRAMPAPAKLTTLSGLLSPRFVHPDARLESEPMAAPPLHRAVGDRVLPTAPGPVYLPDVRQGLLAAELAAHPQPLAHGREALQVPARRLQQGFQRPQQHEAARAGLPQLRVGGLVDGGVKPANTFTHLLLSSATCGDDLTIPYNFLGHHVSSRQAGSRME